MRLQWTVAVWKIRKFSFSEEMQLNAASAPAKCSAHGNQALAIFGPYSACIQPTFFSQFKQINVKKIHVTSSPWIRTHDLSITSLFT